MKRLAHPRLHLLAGGRYRPHRLLAQLSRTRRFLNERAYPRTQPRGFRFLDLVVASDTSSWQSNDHLDTSFHIWSTANDLRDFTHIDLTNIEVSIWNWLSRHNLTDNQLRQASTLWLNPSTLIPVVDIFQTSHDLSLQSQPVL